jgi:hypothetical protein
MLFAGNGYFIPLDGAVMGRPWAAPKGGDLKRRDRGLASCLSHRRQQPDVPMTSGLLTTGLVSYAIPLRPASFSTLHMPVASFMWTSAMTPPLSQATC